MGYRSAEKHANLGLNPQACTDGDVLGDEISAQEAKRGAFDFNLTWP